jgi:hypothetical protein
MGSSGPNRLSVVLIAMAPKVPIKLSSENVEALMIRGDPASLLQQDKPLNSQAAVKLNHLACNISGILG